MIRKLAGAVLLGGAALAVLAPAAAALLASTAREVQMISPLDPSVVELNRAMWSKGEPVVALYGSPVGARLSIVFVRAENLVVPPEDPSLVLYKVDKQKGENPLQVRTLWFFATWIAAGGAAAALAGLAVRKFSGPTRS